MIFLNMAMTLAVWGKDGKNDFVPLVGCGQRVLSPSFFLPGYSRMLPYLHDTITRVREWQGDEWYGMGKEDMNAQHLTSKV